MTYHGLLGKIYKKAVIVQKMNKNVQAEAENIP